MESLWADHKYLCYASVIAKDVGEAPRQGQCQPLPGAGAEVG